MRERQTWQADIVEERGRERQTERERKRKRKRERGDVGDVKGREIESEVGRGEETDR